MSDHFFYLHARDESKTYAPESQIVIDVPTAIAFFGSDGKDSTLELIHGRVKSLVEEWNAQYAGDNAVIK